LYRKERKKRTNEREGKREREREDMPATFGGGGRWGGYGSTAKQPSQ
jgi:hypothetical protein